MIILIIKKNKLKKWSYKNNKYNFKYLKNNINKIIITYLNQLEILKKNKGNKKINSIF